MSCNTMVARTSLRLQLLFSLSTLFFLAWTLLALLDFYNSRYVVAELMDDHLAQTSQMLMGITLHEFSESDNRHVHMEEILSPDIYHENVSFRIWLQDNFLLASTEAPPFQHHYPEGFSDITFEQSWRVLTLRHRETGVTVTVGIPHHIIAAKMGNIAFRLLAPLLMTLPLMVLSIWFGVQRGLHSLRQVAADIGKLSPDQLDPVADATSPREILPLIHALNRLLQRLRHTMEAERRFTAHAAHELRTPLASLKVQSQVALQSTDKEVRQRALENVLAGANRSTHLVQQLLTLSRLDPHLPPQHRHRFAPAPLLQELLAEMAPEAMAKEIELELCDHLPPRENDLVGIDSAFIIMVRNLVDNAIRYTPAHGKILVSLLSQDGGVLLWVDDSGPGIPSAQRLEMFESFRRGNVQDTLGCGLGLSIVARIVALHQGHITLQDAPLGGLRVAVVLPRGP